MTLLDAARLLHDNGKMRVSYDLGSIEATLLTITNTTAVPTLIGCTTDGMVVSVPIDQAQPVAQDGAA